MAKVDDESLLDLLQICSRRAPKPLYPALFAREMNVDRDALDDALDELRRRGLLTLTEWVKGSGQGYALTDAGQQALASRRLTARVAPTAVEEESADVTTDHYARGEQVRASIFEPTRPYVSRGLLILNLLYFAYGAYYAHQHEFSVSDYLQGTSKATTKALEGLGALSVREVYLPHGRVAARPQYERIILFFFLHIGLLHLFMNMYFLTVLGAQIESMWGSVRFLVIYFIAGIVSGCVVLLVGLASRESALTAGASGCLYGIFVALIVWFGLNYQHLPGRLIGDMSRNLMMNMIILVAINFFPGISWQGHLGGAIGGLLAALLLHVQRYHPWRSVRVLALVGVPMIPVGFFVAVLWEAGRL